MLINQEYLKSELKKAVNDQRYLHSLGVVDTARELATRFGGNQEQAEIAAILHDYTKNWSKEQLVVVIRGNDDLSQDLLLYNSELWHGPAASIVIQDKFAIKDPEIISAVRYHTTGREKMSLTEKIVYLADYIEPTRDFPRVEQIRDLAKYDLDDALLFALNTAIDYLLENKQEIYPLTIKARDYLQAEIDTRRTHPRAQQ